MLARRVERVLEPPERPLSRRRPASCSGAAASASSRRERPREAAPELAHRDGVALSRARPRRHEHPSVDPRDPAAARPATERRIIYPRRPRGGAGPSILVVDDDPSLRLLCRREPRARRIRVREAATSTEARAAVAAERPDARPARRPPRPGRTRSASRRAARGGRAGVLVTGDGRARGSADGRTRCCRSRSTRTSWSLSRDGSRRLQLRAMSVAAVRTPDGVRVPPRSATSSSAPRRARGARRGEGGLGAGGDRRSATPTSSRASSSTRCARPRSAPTATSASSSTGCGRRARPGSSPPGSPSARTSSRTGCSPRASTSAARRCRCGRRRRSSRCSPSYAEREELGEIQADASARFNPDRLELIARGRGARAPSSPAIADPSRATRRRRAISLRELSRALEAASDASAARTAALRERWFERLLGPTRGRPVELPRRLRAPALAARVDLHEGARDRGLPATR